RGHAAVVVERLEEPPRLGLEGLHGLEEAPALGERELDLRAAALLVDGAIARALELDPEGGREEDPVRPQPRALDDLEEVRAEVAPEDLRRREVLRVEEVHAVHDEHDAVRGADVVFLEALEHDALVAREALGARDADDHVRAPQELLDLL